MKIYYTNQKPQGQFDKLNLSIGGFQSSTPLINDDFENLFDNISLLSINENRTEYRGLMLFNDDSVTHTNVELWITVPVDCYSDIQLGVVSLNTDTDGNFFMERLYSQNSKPVYVDQFNEFTGIDNALNIGSLLAGQGVGLWFKRALLKDYIKTDMNDCYQKDAVNKDLWATKEKNKEDDIQLFIKWD